MTFNENRHAGGVLPRVDDGGRWLPPVLSAGFGPQNPGTVFRWSNGDISIATGYAWDEGYGKTPNGDNLEWYHTATIIWCNPFYQFLVTQGDASIPIDADMEDEEESDGEEEKAVIQWYPINFHHHETLSRIDYAADSQYLAGNQRNFIAELGLTSYQCQDDDAPVSGGISGNLAILIGLIAFSCTRQELRHVLINDQAWRGYRWRGHQRPTGSKHPIGHQSDTERHLNADVNTGRDGRGKVVSIYLDPDNPGGSTREALRELEWESGHVLI